MALYSGSSLYKGAPVSFGRWCVVIQASPSNEARAVWRDDCAQVLMLEIFGKFVLWRKLKNLLRDLGIDRPGLLLAQS